ncbi:hypothetical protein BDF20DRAFT_6789 [Mycotypha africana]|uniref:uncharacterized protein n=1 Tax=Mycotypha africana TaxID=64632 RepID=UPI002300DBD5|nr:uncharacterized protein BDF20DRAFT_6789 [Mycotypha africana]KAI8990872.1 hypothetical protein BDF20DRAFT_6789 [Mycotypha africana]
MHEFAEKTALIAGFGKYLTDLIDTEPTIKAGQPRLSPIQRKPYVKGAEAAMIVADAMNAIQQWKPLAEDERPTLANSNGSVTALSVVSNDSSISHSHAKSDDSTGDFPAASEQPIQQRVPPALPPRRLTEEGTANTPTTPTTAHDEIPPPLPPKTSHVSPSLVNSTGDLKTKNEVGIDSAAYEAPPPAYEEKAGKASTAAAAQRGTIHSSISDHKNLPVPPPHIPAHQGQHHTAHLSMSYDPPHSPEPSSAAAAVTTSSPLSTHSQTVFESPLLHQQQSSSTSFHDPTKASTSVNSQQQFQIDYHHLYHRQYQQQQQQQQQQQYPYYRPYSEFQQQVHHHQQQQQQQQQRPRIDAGGFRIPPTSSSTFMSAEEEKERLAHYYRQQQQQPSSFASHTLNNNQSSSKSSHYEQKTQE